MQLTDQVNYFPSVTKDLPPPPTTEDPETADTVSPWSQYDQVCYITTTMDHLFLINLLQCVLAYVHSLSQSNLGIFLRHAIGFKEKLLLPWEIALYFLYLFTMQI